MTKHTNTNADHPSESPKKKRKLWIWGIAFLLILLLPFTALTIYVSGYDGIFPNIYVGDMPLAGKTADEAYGLLNRTYQNTLITDQILVLQCEDTIRELPASDLGIVYQNRETVNEALSISDTKNPIFATVQFINQLLHPVHITPSISYNSELLKDAINEVALPYEVEPVNYTFEIAKDEVTIHAPVAGVKVDRDAVIAEVESGIRRMLLFDVTMKPVTTPAETLDFDTFYAWLTSPAENASYSKNEDGTVQVNQEKLQCTVDKETVKNAIQSIEESGNPKATFAVVTTEPEILSLALTENLYKDKLGSYTTYYSGTYARNNNVQLATRRIDGYELMPGEEFSYDQTILPRTAANGYMAAPVYVGNKVESGMGGGICQPSSTLYGAALYANLEILERHNHSMQVSYMPAGLDATIAQGALDLRLRNSTPYPVKISAQASGGVLTFSIWGYNPENISVDILRSGSGYQYYATRVVKKDGKEISREALSSSRYVPPEPTPTPSASPEPDASPSPEDGENAATPAPSEGTGNLPENTEAPSVPTEAATPVPAPTVAPATTEPTIIE